MVLPTQNLASASTKSGATMPVATACGNCGMDERRLLHHVRHRGIFRRLCTSCVLRLHPQSFCPTCFVVYHPSPPPSGTNDAVTCLKCYSSSHSQCVGPNPPSPYVCPICVNPNSPIFTLTDAKCLKLPNNNGNNSVNNENSKVIDLRAATILLAAARIASVSMTKAATAARAEAERKAKEAAFTKKRAKEALEDVIYLAAKEKMMKNQALLASGVVNSRAGNGNLSSVGGLAGGALPERQQRVSVGNGERIDSSNEVMAALNAVELREKQKLVSGQSSINGVAMGTRVASSSITMTSSVQNHHTGASVTEIQQKVSQAMVLVQDPVPIQILARKDDQMQGVRNGHHTGASVTEIQQKVSNAMVLVQDPLPIQILGSKEDDQMQGVRNGHLTDQETNKPPQ